MIQSIFRRAGTSSEVIPWPIEEKVIHRVSMISCGQALRDPLKKDRRFNNCT